MRSIKLYCVLPAVVCLTFSQVARSSNATASVAVSANVIASCMISTMPIKFGNYDPVGANASSGVDLVNTAGTVTVTCTPGSGNHIALDLGTHAHKSVRRMENSATSPAHFLTYEVYLPPDSKPGTACHSAAPVGTIIWNATNTLAVGAAPDAKPRSYHLCAAVTKAQVVPAGAYTDTLMATINF